MTVDELIERLETIKATYPKAGRHPVRVGVFAYGITEVSPAYHADRGDYVRIGHTL